MTQSIASTKLLFGVIAICIVAAAVFVGLNLQPAQTPENTETPDGESSIPAGAVKNDAGNRPFSAYSAFG